MSEAIRPTSRDAVIAAAFAVLAETPNASLADIAARAGVGRATLHRHFTGRDDLIVTMGLTALEEMEEAADAACLNVKSYSEALRVTLEALIPLGDRYQFVMREQLDDHPQIAKETARQQDETRKLVERAKKEGLFDPAHPTDWIVQAYDHLLFAAWESVRAQELTPTQAAKLAWRTLTNGLGA